MTLHVPHNPAAAIDAQSLKDALAQFATGVTVVTTRSDTGWLGITVSSFSALSLEPPLVLWSLNKTSSRTKVFIEAEHFGVHVLSNTQQDLCLNFAKEGAAFDQENTQSGRSGVPLLKGCLARFECSRHAVHEGGDHLIFVARVDAISLQKGDPLIYYDRSFGAFQS